MKSPFSVGPSAAQTPTPDAVGGKTVRYPQVESGVVEVTPALATEWLTTVRHGVEDRNNRHLRPRKVGDYARDMAAGDWKLNGATIVIDKYGDITDGQHRLEAVVKSGATVEMFVVTGVEPDVFPTIDTGTKRSFGDVLFIKGNIGGSRYAHVASLARSLYRWQAGSYRHDSASTNPTHAEMMGVVEKYPLELEASALAGVAVRRALRAPNTPMALCHFLFSEIDAEQANEFFHGLVEGTDLEEGSPIAALRRWFINRGAQRGRFDSTEVVAVTVKAWNHWRRGNHVRLLGWRPAGNEPVPSPR